MIRYALLVLSAIMLISCDQTAERTGKLVSVPDGIVAENATWEDIDSAYVYTDSPASDAEGNVYFADVAAHRIMKLGTDGQVNVFVSDTAQAQGLRFGPDGYLYACRQKDAQIVRYRPDTSYEVLAQGVGTPRKDTNLPAAMLLAVDEYCNDLAADDAGGVWFTDRENEQIIYVSPDGGTRTVASGFRGNGIQLSLDKQMLVVTDSNEQRLHAFTVAEDGSLVKLPDYFEPLKVFVRKGQDTSEVRTGANGMTLDSDGRFYVATFLGVQIFDADGRHVGVIKGATGYMSNIGFGGTDRNWLYSTGSKVSRLRMDVQGAMP